MEVECFIVVGVVDGIWFGSVEFIFVEFVNWDVICWIGLICFMNNFVCNWKIIVIWIVVWWVFVKFCLKFWMFGVFGNDKCIWMIVCDVGYCCEIVCCYYV